MAAAMAALQRRGTALRGAPPLRFILLFGAAFSEHPRHLEAFQHGRVGAGRTISRASRCLLLRQNARVRPRPLLRLLPRLLLWREPTPSNHRPARQVPIPTLHVIGHRDFVKEHSINLVGPRLPAGPPAVCWGLTAQPSLHARARARAAWAPARGSPRARPLRPRPRRSGSSTRPSSSSTAVGTLSPRWRGPTSRC
jgi:hypothetical protein